MLKVLGYFRVEFVYGFLFGIKMIIKILHLAFVLLKLPENYGVILVFNLILPSFFNLDIFINGNELF